VANIKLPKLPDRTPVKLTIAVSPALKKALDLYAELYRESYGSEENVCELIPYLLSAFLDSDRQFVNRIKNQPGTR
jgi:hypothetical protein